MDLDGSMNQLEEALKQLPKMKKISIAAEGSRAPPKDKPK